MMHISIYETVMATAEPWFDTGGRGYRSSVHLHYGTEIMQRLGYLAITPDQAEALAKQLVISARQARGADAAREAALKAATEFPGEDRPAPLAKDAAE